MSTFKNLCTDCEHSGDHNKCNAGGVDTLTGESAPSRWKTMERGGLYMTIGCLVVDHRLPCGKGGRNFKKKVQ